MQEVHVDDVVRLVNDVPELWLERGELGVVKSVWHLPLSVLDVQFPFAVPDAEAPVYEVEFVVPGSKSCVRAVLPRESVAVEKACPAQVSPARRRPAKAARARRAGDEVISRN